jgi:hypothetical protein
MQTGTAIISSSGYDQYPLLGAQPDRLSEQGLSLTGRGNFPSTDVNNLCSVLHGLADSPCQI